MGFFSNVGRWIANPISAGLDQVGLGAEGGFDFITGRGAAREAAESAEKDRALQLELWNKNVELQREFAQHGIKWRVDDALSSGIHPLAALGASGASYSPSMPLLDPLPSANSWKHEMGQNVRGFLLNKLNPMTRIMDKLSVERAGLENDLLRLQILNEAKNGGGGSNDPHLAGQGGIGAGNPLVTDLPLQRTVAEPSDPSKEAGAYTDWQMVRSGDGYAIVPSQQTKQAIEDSPMEWQWLARNVFKVHTLPDGTKGLMNPLTGKIFTGKAFREMMFGNKVLGKPRWRD